ncbi:MAG: TraR/DksA C4-type zinc finger protein [Candidatus Rokubacteria bacterium]|nr:TraR/DksA C4-type zinc finger protein [Candidatus Rokubacteria bacterium]
MTTTERAIQGTVAEEFRRALLEARARLLRTVATTDDELETLEGHQPGAPTEDVAREQALAILSRLGERERHELEEIHAACARLDAGIFGLCEGCQGPIPLARLGAMPTARLCLGCQARREPRAS